MAMYLGSLSGGLGKPSSRNAVLRVVGAGAMASGCSTFPATKIGVPATEVIGGNVVGFIFPVLSAMRPPHPLVPAPVETEVCHWFCWSECEKRLTGRGTVRLM